MSDKSLKDIMEVEKDIQKDIVLYSTPEVDDFYDHAKKLVSAVYLLTSLFDENEPLKWHLRKKVIEAMSDTGVFSKVPAKKASGEVFAKIHGNVSEVLSLIEMGVFSGVVSSMNGDILLREFKSFQNNISQYSKNSDGGFASKTKDIFSESRPKRVTEAQGVFKGHKRTSKPIKDNNVLYKKTPKENGADDRKTKILDIVKEKGNVMIKDISTQITDCSEKTIQRDLIDLVSQGKLTKTGERRWTVYSIPE